MTAAVERPPAEETRPGGPSMYALLLALIGLLTVIGMVMVLSASQVQALKETGSTWSYFLRHLAYVGAGGALLAVTTRVDYRAWRRFSVPLLLGCWVLLVAVLIPGIGVEVNYSRSWIGVGEQLRFQPAELAKVGVLLFTADLLARRARHMGNTRITLRPVLLILGITAGLVMAQPDLGSTLIIGTVVLSVLFLAGVPLLRLGGVMGLGVAATLFLATRKSYRLDRIMVLLDPSSDPMGAGYHVNQSLMGVASGGVFGVGLGAGRSKYGFLPNPHTDFIFTVIGEELGLLGALVVIGCFLAFALLGTKVALSAPDRFGTLVAGGITAWVLVQAFVNIGGVLSILPVTGLTLPFISFGGTSLVITLASAGILLNIARQSRPGRRAA